MPRVSAAYHAARRRQILDAARARFARDGFHAASMDDIIAEAGVSPSTVYRQFEGKEALVRAVVDDVLDEFSSLLRATLSAGHSPADVIARVLDSAPSSNGAARRQGRAIAIYAWAEAQRDAALRRHLRGRYLELIGVSERLLARLRDEGALPADADVGGLAQALAALVPGSYIVGMLLGETKVAAAVASLVGRGRPRRRRGPAG
ncbi:MAG TPA: TetR/AcrR family transcriptional regulator [Polyangiaceae bacterium]|nr:TetR/AcrR family transcriptional regulator [Polyangiaceae bacterium]